MIFGKAVSIVRGTVSIVRGTDSRSGWEYLRRIRRSPVFGSIVFFPILSALLTLGEQLSNTFDLIAFHFSTASNQSAPISEICDPSSLQPNFDFPLRLHIFYWSLFSLFLGTVIYTARCPDMFIRYGSKFDYASGETEILRHPAFARRTLEFVDGRLADFGPAVNSFAPKVVDDLRMASRKLSRELDRNNGAIDPIFITEFISAHWSFMNRARRFSRALIQILYYLGIILIGVLVFCTAYDIFMAYFSEE